MFLALQRLKTSDGIDDDIDGLQVVVVVVAQTKIA
jgi:hypothetical protein